MDVLQNVLEFMLQLYVIVCSYTCVIDIYRLV